MLRVWVIPMFFSMLKFLNLSNYPATMKLLFFPTEIIAGDLSLGM